jgi:bifunctional non-homologous end joining protein LigD
VRWVEPQLVAEVELRGWTADGLLRHASFKGLRDDKEPADVVRESSTSTASGAGRNVSLRLTHPDRVLWPDVGLTKQGLAEFYADIADWVLPHVVGRPLALVRCPSGVGTDCFFQKHAWNGIGKAIRRKRVAGEEVLFIEDLEGLLTLAQSSVLEIHPWGSKIGAIERPDRITFDLDPAENVPWTVLIEGAIEVRERLRALGLRSFVKTTGGKGLHLVVPLAPKARWHDVKAFAQDLAETMAKDRSDRFVATVSKRARSGRIFIDYLRNGRGATAVAAFSTRARSGAPVSTPLAWEELSPSIRPNHYSVENLPRRLRYLGSGPWPDLDEVQQELPATRTLRRSKQ